MKRALLSLAFAAAMGVAVAQDATTIPGERERAFAWMQCAHGAEMIFRLSQERRYNGGTIESLRAAAEGMLTPAEVAVQMPMLLELWRWVDEHPAATAKDQALTSMTECTSAYYGPGGWMWGEIEDEYATRFQDVLRGEVENPWGPGI